MIELSFAKEEDLIKTTECIRELFIQSYHSRFSTFDFDHVLSLQRSAINNKSRECVIILKTESDVIGVIIGKAINQLFNKSELIAVEVAFFIVNGYRNFHSIRLLYGAFKQWAKLVGCQTIMMGRIREPGKQEEYFLKRIK